MWFLWRLNEYLLNFLFAISFSSNFGITDQLMEYKLSFISLLNNRLSGSNTDYRHFTMFWTLRNFNDKTPTGDT